MTLPRFTLGSLGGEITNIAATTRIAAATAPAPAPAMRTAAPDTVFVELGEAAQKAQIARDGIGVPTIRLNTDALQNIIAGRPQLVTKVVSQSVAPGTAVPRGTSVDVVLAQPGALPIEVIRDPHVSLSGRTLSNVYDSFIRDNAAVRNVLARNDSATTLSTADRGVIESAFQAHDVPVSDQPGQGIEQAFSSLQAAFTFGT